MRRRRLPRLLQNTGEAQPAPSATPEGPATLTLKDALELAQKNDPLYLSALTDEQVAAEDVRQARAARYPTLTDSTQYLGTQGNGKTPNGRFVTNDGVHVYREWGVVHEEFNAGLFTGSGIDRAAAVQAVARARAEVARRGLAPYGHQSVLRLADCAAQVLDGAAGCRSSPARADHQPRFGARRRGGAQRRSPVATAVECSAAGAPGGDARVCKPRVWIWRSCYIATLA